MKKYLFLLILCCAVSTKADIIQEPVGHKHLSPCVIITNEKEIEDFRYGNERIGGCAYGGNTFSVGNDYESSGILEGMESVFPNDVKSVTYHYKIEKSADGYYYGKKIKEESVRKTTKEKIDEKLVLLYSYRNIFLGIFLFLCVVFLISRLKIK